MPPKNMLVGRTFLVGMDGSKFCIAAMEEAATTLGNPKRNDEFILLHVVSKEKPVAAQKDMVNLAESEQFLKDLGYSVRVDVIETDTPVGLEIVKQCQFHSVDFLVLGCRGLGLVESLIGSVTEYCVHHANCAVIINHQ